jgi:hypothetical protein
MYLNFSEMPQAAVAKLMKGKEWKKNKYKNVTLSQKHRTKENEINPFPLVIFVFLETLLHSVFVFNE